MPGPHVNARFALLHCSTLYSARARVDSHDVPGRVAAWLFLAFCLIYLGTARGVLDTVDDVAMLRVTESLVTSGSLAVADDTPGALRGVDGRWYTRYGLGQSLLALPFFALGSRLPAEAPRVAPYDPHGLVLANPVAFAVTLVGLLSSALSVALVYLTCRALDLEHVGALAAALALGLGTFAWHYGRTFMSEPTSMLAAILAFYALTRFAQDVRARWALVSGAACAALMLLRIGNAVLLPALGLYLVWLSMRTRSWMAVVAWSAPILVCGGLLALLNSVRFGSLTETGYADQVQAFSTPLFVGAYGLLLSAGKGVLFYAPIVLAGVIGWFPLVRRQPAAAWTIALLVGAYVAFYARFEWWYGGGPWGPRFLTVILPFLCLPIGALVTSGLSLGSKLALVGLAAVSVGIQMLSLAVPYLPYEANMTQDEIAYQRLLWNPDASPIVVHARSLIGREYPLDLAFTYYPWPWLAWLQLAALVAGFGLLCVGVWSSWRSPRRRRLAMSEALPA
jgi:Dolichyl-phosphate-mannose-protein mannosyltransferase